MGKGYRPAPYCEGDFLDSPLLVLLILLAGAFAASEAGFQLGRLFGPGDEVFTRHLGVIRGATFAMVAFLLGFSFAGAASRYVDRLDMIVKEANAIGTAYLRADLLAQPAQGELKAALREYTADRIGLLNMKDKSIRDARLSKVSRFHERMWAAALRGTSGQPEAMRLVLPSLNDVIDLHTTHLSAARRHVPTPIMVILLTSAALALVLAGFGNGQVGRRFPILNFVYGIVLATALWMTFDLDHPRQGLIRASDQPLIDAMETMKP